MQEPLPQLWRNFFDEVAAHGPLVRRTDEWLCLGWPQDKPEQTVQLTARKLDTRWFLFLTADVCPADVAPTRLALELAAKLLVGSVMINRGVLSLRHVFLESTLTRAAFWETIEALRDNAVRFREHLLPQKDAAALGLFKYVID
jgi:hypothetical protein